MGKLVAVGCIVLVIAIFCAISGCNIDGQIEWTSEYYDLYHVNAPFGTFWVDVEGRFVFGCGRITSEFMETYTAKYFKGGQLLTLNINAEKTPVVVDGTFRFEVQREYMRVRRWWESESSLISCERYRGVSIKYIIHIPALPSVNQTLQWEIIQ